MLQLLETLSPGSFRGVAAGFYWFRLQLKFNKSNTGYVNVCLSVWLYASISSEKYNGSASF